MHPLVKAFKEDNSILLKPRLRIALAISGGVDSVALLRLLLFLDLKPTLLHFNFKLRSEDSDLDEQFIENLAKEYNLEFFCKSAEDDFWNNQHQQNIQLEARKLRYDWFDSLSAQFDFILTAHTASDQLETTLFRISRGMGWRGWSGIPKFRNPFYRPLLSFPKTDLVNFLNDIGQTWREDSSNSKTDYSRNFIRHEVVPKLKKLNPIIEETNARNQQRWGNAASFLASSINKFSEENLVTDSDSKFLQFSAFQGKEDATFLTSELLQNLGFSYEIVQEIIQKCFQQSGLIYLSETYKLITEINGLRLQEINSIKNNSESEIQILSTGFFVLDDENSVDVGNIHPKEISAELLLDPTIAIIDLDLFPLPFIIRKAKNGDRFLPFGMNGSKLLSDLFTDLKMSQFHRSKTWLLINNDRILWVIKTRKSELLRMAEPKTNGNYLQVKHHQKNKEIIAGKVFKSID